MAIVFQTKMFLQMSTTFNLKHQSLLTSTQVMQVSGNWTLSVKDPMVVSLWIYTVSHVVDTSCRLRPLLMVCIQSRALLAGKRFLSVLTIWSSKIQVNLPPSMRGTILKARCNRKWIWPLISQKANGRSTYLCNVLMMKWCNRRNTTLLGKPMVIMLNLLLRNQERTRWEWSHTLNPFSNSFKNVIKLLMNSVLFLISCYINSITRKMNTWLIN